MGLLAQSAARAHAWSVRYPRKKSMTDRSLQKFFDAIRSVHQANRTKSADWYDIIERIDRCFVRAGNWSAVT